jgi:hypothetical protein
MSRFKWAGTFRVLLALTVTAAFFLAAGPALAWSGQGYGQTGTHYYGAAPCGYYEIFHDPNTGIDQLVYHGSSQTTTGSCRSGQPNVQVYSIQPDVQVYSSQPKYGGYASQYQFNQSMGNQPGTAYGNCNCNGGQPNTYRPGQPYYRAPRGYVYRQPPQYRQPNPYPYAYQQPYPYYFRGPAVLPQTGSYVPSLTTPYGDYTRCEALGLHQANCFAPDPSNSPNLGSIQMEPQIQIWGNCTVGQTMNDSQGRVLQCSKTGAGWFQQ